MENGSQQEKVKKIIGRVTIIAWILEIIKIIFNIVIGNGNNPNTYIPLYYCSLLLYAGIFSSVCKGKLKRVGDVFLQTGAIIAGLVFLVFPTTSIATYPAFHFISIQSFVYHGMMIYLGIIMNKANYIELNKNDIIYYALLIVITSIVAYIVNILLDTNLMFISKDFPSNPITIIYKHTGGFYPLIMTFIQAIPPFTWYSGWTKGDGSVCPKRKC